MRRPLSTPSHARSGAASGVVAASRAPRTSRRRGVLAASVASSDVSFSVSPLCWPDLARRCLSPLAHSRPARLSPPRPCRETDRVAESTLVKKNPLTTLVFVPNRSVANHRFHRQAPPSTSTSSSLSPALAARVRADFPILDQTLEAGRRLVYLDNGATSQKPKQVIDAMSSYYERDNSNVHRGVHQLAARATAAYEASRSKVASFVGASTDREVVFTKNATEGINLVANSWGGEFLGPGDEVLISELEHHANIVPWQLIAAKKGARVRVVPLTRDKSRIDVDALSEMLKGSGGRIKVVALCHVSNVLGSVLPAADVAEMCRSAGARLLLDCCQTLPAMPLDVSSLGADWVVASAHKACGPTGIGFLWGRPDVLEEMPPFLGGGEMIDTVTLEGSTFAPPPARFEAGTPAIAEAVGFGAAVDYLSSLGSGRSGGMEAVAAAEEELGGLLHEGLSSIDGVTVYGPRFGEAPRAALASFNVEGLHATDVSTLLDHAGVAVRSGHHCAQPLHSVLGCNASARASPYFYNTSHEVEVFLEELKGSIKFFRDAGL